jgi:type III restriction enzyme
VNQRVVSAIAGRLSLRPPQRRSLEILDRLTEFVSPRKAVDREAALTAINAAWPTVADFEREFPSLCFALATGVGKTRLMGAFISYLHLAHGVKHFFVLAPNLTIYNKLIADFTPNTPKYVFRGVAEFATGPPQIITGDNYDATLLDELAPCRVNIFNISKINSEVRGGKAPRIKRLSEYLGESYFEYLASLDDLVLLMDESHRYRASAGVKAINELRPILGLELTATPFIETTKGRADFKNVVYRYQLAEAMRDGFVKEPAVVTRKDFTAVGLTPDRLEQIKLEDGVRMHERVKVDLDTYARETRQPLVKPFMLVIARDVTHASQLLALIESEQFFEGRYKGKVLQVDSSRTGAEEDAMVEKLLRVEQADEPTEIVIHVNMLKEGWDVTNLYTIVPLRAANARTLVEQSIGRGLRLPYGRRTGVTALDRLSIVAHDRFQEIVDDANRADSPVKIQAVELTQEELEEPITTVVSASVLTERLGLVPTAVASGAGGAAAFEAVMFTGEAERRVAETAVHVIESLSARPGVVPGVAYLTRPDVQAQVVREVREQMPGQLVLEGVTSVDVPRVVADVCGAVVEGTMDIPRVLVTPVGYVESGFHPFTLDLSNVNYPEVSEELWIQHLRTRQTEVVAAIGAGIRERRPEDYIVRGLIEFDDISYDEQSDLLYDLAGQVVRHLQSYLAPQAIEKVLQFHQRALAGQVHAQMQDRYWEKVERYEANVTHGFTPLLESAFTAIAGELHDFHLEPADKSKIGRMVFVGFRRCLYRKQKFGSDTERRFAVILDRDSLRWFKPAYDQFQIYYQWGIAQPRYVPDFVAETATELLMVETKSRRELESAEVAAKKAAAEQWCLHASAHARSYGGKPWRYVLVPHDVVTDNMTLEFLASRRA